jgi:hypothetical protein
MSLDVYLKIPGIKISSYSFGIFIRRNGMNEEIPREEWDKMYPGVEPVCLAERQEHSDTVFEYNITHNLGKMANEAGIYQALWRPEEIDAEKALDITDILESGLCELIENPEKYKRFNPENGWGNYDGLVQFVTKYLTACKEYPEATITVSR